MPCAADFPAAKRRAPGRRTSGSASMAFTTVSTRSEYVSKPAGGSIAMKTWPMRGLLPCSAKKESAPGPVAAPVREAQGSSIPDQGRYALHGREEHEPEEPERHHGSPVGLPCRL